MKKILFVALFLTAGTVYAQPIEDCCNPKANPSSQGVCVPASNQGCASGNYLVQNCDICKKAVIEYNDCKRKSRYCDFETILSHHQLTIKR